MQTIWNPDSRRVLRTRLERLDANASGRWGRMTAPQAVAHMVDATRMALGELSCSTKQSPLRYPVIKHLIIYWLPWPKGAPTAPELIGRAPTSIAMEIAELQLLVDRVGQLPASFSWPEHPAFGRLSHRTWGVLIHRHLDHHLTQFGA